MEIALLIIVFGVIFSCHYFIVKRKDSGSVAGSKKPIWDIICLILSITMIVVFGLRFLSLWRENNDITTQFIVYILFIIGCIVHFVRIFTKDRRGLSRH
ncbi:MAG: hypothetical protein ACI358_02350 [Candidatus Limimorpha sp.]